MINRLIEQYVNRMTKNDIIVFANKNGIELNEGEVKIIYNHIKNIYINFKEKYKNYL